MILVLRKALAGLPRSLDGIRSILLLPLLGVGLTGFLMFLINIPMAAINTGLEQLPLQACQVAQQSFLVFLSVV